MSNEKIRVKMVTFEEPCTACVITANLMKEILQKVEKELDNISIEIVELKHINEIYSIVGLEVEKFPAVLINDEQVSAGNLVLKKQLIKYIELAV